MGKRWEAIISQQYNYKICFERISTKPRIGPTYRPTNMVRLRLLTTEACASGNGMLMLVAKDEPKYSGQHGRYMFYTHRRDEI